MSLPEPLPLHRLARAGGRPTSLASAVKATAASRKAVRAVYQLMLDEVSRIDEEIWAGCRQGGFSRTLATIQHARLALAESGYLVRTAATRQTSNGAQAEEWCVHDPRESLPADTPIGRKPKKPPARVFEVRVREDRLPQLVNALPQRARESGPDAVLGRYLTYRLSPEELLLLLEHGWWTCQMNNVWVAEIVQKRVSEMAEFGGVRL